jgi:hypothetical protein
MNPEPPHGSAVTLGPELLLLEVDRHAALLRLIEAELEAEDAPPARRCLTQGSLIGDGAAAVVDLDEALVSSLCEPRPREAEQREAKREPEETSHPHTFLLRRSLVRKKEHPSMPESAFRNRTCLRAPHAIAVRSAVRHAAASMSTRSAS